MKELTSEELNEIYPSAAREESILPIIPMFLRHQLWPNHDRSWDGVWLEIIMLAGENLDG